MSPPRTVGQPFASRVWASHGIDIVKIASVQTIIVRVPFTHGDTASSGRAGNLRLSTINTLLVRLETQTGLVGWGEAFGFNLVDATKAAIDTVLTPLCIGEDTATIIALLTRRTHNYGRNGPDKLRHRRDRHRAMGHRRQSGWSGHCIVC